VRSAHRGIWESRWMCGIGHPALSSPVVATGILHTGVCLAAAACLQNWSTA
jgi:hypothetical protein